MLDKKSPKRCNSALSGRIAQLVEQRIENPRVDGSIPSPATTKFSITPFSLQKAGFLFVTSVLLYKYPAPSLLLLCGRKMMKLTSNQQQQLQILAERYNVDLASVEALLDSLKQGNGKMAQFNIPALGGLGQWMQGNMVMLSDMFNNNLKNTVNNLSNDLVNFIDANGLLAPTSNSAATSGSSQTQSQTDASGKTKTQSSGTAANASTWWPADWGSPASTGSQNGTEYAVFPAKQRLAIKTNGDVNLYDTGDNQISGISQYQSNGALGTVMFTSQKGTLKVDDLPKVAA